MKRANAFVVLTLTVLLGSESAAQDTVSGSRVIVSAGAGGIKPFRSPERPNVDLSASLGFPLSDSLVLEAEVSRSSGASTGSGLSDNRLDRPYITFSTSAADTETWRAGANLLFRTPVASRLTAFAGGGLGGQRSVFAWNGQTTCQPRVANGCDSYQPGRFTSWQFVRSGLSWQLLGGADVTIAPRLTAFGTAHWRSGGEDEGLGATAGVRIPLGARRAQTPAGRDATGTKRTRVHVLETDRSREGYLVALGDAEVVLDEGGTPVTIPLSRVRRIERVTHRRRTAMLAGAGAGFVAFYLSSCGGGDEEDCWPEIGAIGAGIGAGVGALVTAGRRAGDVLYEAPNKRATLRVTPAVGRGAAGVSLSMDW